MISSQTQMMEESKVQVHQLIQQNQDLLSKIDMLTAENITLSQQVKYQDVVSKKKWNKFNLAIKTFIF